MRGGREGGGEEGGREGGGREVGEVAGGMQGRRMEEGGV